MWLPKNILKASPGSGAAAANKPNVTFVRLKDILSFPVRDGNGVKMLGDFVMKSGSVMFTVYFTPSKQVKNYSTEGDEDMETVKQKYEGWSPGDELDLNEFVQNNLGVDYVIIANNCTDGYKRVYGTPCAPVKLKADQSDDSSGRGVKLVFEQIVGSKYVPAFYNGTEVFAAPTATDESVDATVANGAQFQLAAFAVTASIAFATTDLTNGAFVTLIGGGGVGPATFANGATTAGTVVLKDGTTWTALENATITFEVVDDGATIFFIERART